MWSKIKFFIAVMVISVMGVNDPGHVTVIDESVVINHIFTNLKLV